MDEKNRIVDLPLKLSLNQAPNDRPYYGEKAVAVVHIDQRFIGPGAALERSAKVKKKKDFLAQRIFQVIGI